MPGPKPLPAALTDVLEASRAAIARAWMEAEQALDAWPNPPEAMLGADQFTEAVAAMGLPARGLRLRGRQARRWRLQDDLSLAGLGDELEDLGLVEEGKDHKTLAAKLDRAGAAAPGGDLQ